MNGFAGQLWLGARSLLRSPGFTVTAVLTLALGIGLATAVFTVADALVLRRLPVLDQDRLVLLWGETRDGQSSKFPLALNEVRDFARGSRSLSSVAFFAFRGAVPAPIQVGDNFYPIRLGLVSGNFFDVLGSAPTIGRSLRVEDDIPGAAPVVVLSYHSWQQQFGGAPNVVGKTISMFYTGRNYRIAGVMPQGLEYPRGTDVWAPLVAYGSAGGFLEILSGELNVLGRLRPEAPPSLAREELSAFLARPESPASHKQVRGAAYSLSDYVLGDTKPALLLVTLAAVLLLLLTCVNVANLLLVRALGRVDEFEVRSALGAGRGRMMTQLLIESGLLAIAGGVVGVALANAAVKFFVAFAPGDLPRADEIGVNVITIVAAVLLTSVAMMLSGLGPAFFASRMHGHEALRSGARQTGGRRVRAVAELLVVAQIALAAVTLTAAGLVTRSLLKLQHVNLAFDPGKLLVVSLAMRPDQLSDPQKQRAALNVIVANVKALAGVRSATPVMSVPFVADGGGVDGRLSLAAQSKEESASNPIVNMEIAAPNYFSALGIPILRGRSFTAEDSRASGAVVVISSSVAKHFWPHDDPIGRQLVELPEKYTVVGVVPETRYREVRKLRPTVYFPMEQWPDAPSTLLVRTTGSPETIVPALRRTIADAHLGVTFVSASTLNTLLDAPRAAPRLNTFVFAFFAFAAMLLAAIGLFAIIATLVRQRTHEFGIRLALGATSQSIHRIVMVRGIAIAMAGTAIGISIALAGRRLVSGLLFEVSPTDSTTLVAVAALLLSVALIASFFPARLGMRVDPAIALRS